MKKILASMALAFVSMCCANAQSNSISLYVYAAEQKEDIPENSLDYLVNSLCTAVATDGLAAQNDHYTQFVLRPKVNIATKNLLASTQQQIALTLDVSLQVTDDATGTVFASKTVSVKGVGANETKAYNMAFRSLNRNNSAIKELAAAAKKKILDYYDAEAENIIKRAKLAAATENYDEAFYLLSMVPSQCSRFDDVTRASLEIWKGYKNFSCSKNLAKAWAVWNANQSVEAANEAGSYLAEIFQDADCYDETQDLYKEIKAKVGELWKFDFKVYDNEHELDMVKIKAMQAIGVAYGKGQQPGMIIHKSKY